MKDAKNPEKNIYLNDIWPQERDVVVRPERLKYVRRMAIPKKCVFCEAASTKKHREKLVVYKGKEAMVLLNKYPYNSGHVLVMPLRHEGALEELSASEHAEISYLVKESVRILKKVYACKGLNVGLNLGAAAGAGIPDHLHFHVIPRWYGDTNFFPLIAETKLIVETLESTFAKLAPEYAELAASFTDKTAPSKKEKNGTAVKARSKLKSKNWK